MQNIETLYLTENSTKTTISVETETFYCVWRTMPAACFKEVGQRQQNTGVVSYLVCGYNLKDRVKTISLKKH